MTALITTSSPLPAPTGITADLFNRWISYIDAKPKTVETYTRSIRHFVSYLAD